MEKQILDILTTIQKDLTEVKQDLAEVKQRVSTLENKVETGFSEMRFELQKINLATRYDQLYTDLQRLPSRDQA